MVLVIGKIRCILQAILNISPILPISVMRIGFASYWIPQDRIFEIQISFGRYLKP